MHWRCPGETIEHREHCFLDLRDETVDPAAGSVVERWQPSRTFTLTRALVVRIESTKMDFSFIVSSIFIFIFLYFPSAVLRHTFFKLQFRNIMAGPSSTHLPASFYAESEAGTARGQCLGKGHSLAGACVVAHARRLGQDQLSGKNVVYPQARASHALPIGYHVWA